MKRKVHTSPQANASKWTVAAFPLILASFIALVGAAQSAELPAAAHFRKEIQPILSEHCYDCHGDGMKKGSVALDEFKSDREIIEKRDLWLAVLKNVRAGLMPPEKKPRLSPEEITQFEQWIKFEAFGIDPHNPDPGRVTVRRLNRIEYRNTIRDLMGIDFNSEVEFPPDDTGYGFDNIGDVLSISPLLLEKYMGAAKAIVTEAVPTVSKVVAERTVAGNRFQGARPAKERNRKETFLPLSYYEAVAVSNKFRVEQSGSYRLLLELAAKGNFDFDPGRCRVIFKVDDQELLTKEFGWYDFKTFRFELDQKWEPGDHQMALTLEPLTPIEKKTNSLDMRIVSVTIRGPTEKEHWVRPKNYDRFFTGEAPKTPTARRKYAADVLRKFATKAFRRPVDTATVDRLVKVAEKVYSQPNKTFEAGVAHAMVAVLSSPRFLFRLEEPEAFFASRNGPAGSLAPGERAGMRIPPINDSRIEPLNRPAGLPLPKGEGRGEGERSVRKPLELESKASSFVDEYSLASRLSYFLWSTTPDDELFRLAQSGELRKNLSSQVKRMLADSRSEALVENFTGQWLQTRDVEGIDINARAVLGRDAGEQRGDFARRRQRFQELTAIPEALRTPEEKAELRAMFERRRRFNRPEVELDRDLRQALREETYECFAYVMRRDRSVLELIDSDYTFLNEKLAKHYGLTNLDITGPDMRRVKLPPDNARGGVLTHGSVLVVTSNPDRTSPVKRGLFVLDNFLGTPAPPPPGNVPALEVAEKDVKDHDPTLREALSIHREKPLCASCHNRMDPIGLAFENFNALGMWREKERKQPIETGGKLITGESFNSIRELKQILASKHRLDYYRCLTEKFLTYAVGRGMEYYDMETIDQIVQRLDGAEGRFSALLMGVIESAPFQKMRRQATETSSNFNQPSVGAVETRKVAIKK